MAIFNEQAIAFPWDETKDHYFKYQEKLLTIRDVAGCIGTLVERSYETQTGRADRIQVLVDSIKTSKSADQDLPFDDDANQHFMPGDTIIVQSLSVCRVSRLQQDVKRASFALASPVQSVALGIPFTEIPTFLKGVRASLRYGLNDRVICRSRSCWFSGHIVGTAVFEEAGLFQLSPYLVKTDPRPGIKSNIIRVENDNDEICKLEVCFDPLSELYLIKAAAVVVAKSRKPKTRFTVGDKVVCRVHSNIDDGLEQWVSGTVSLTWAKLGTVSLTSEINRAYLDLVPYKINLNSGGWIYCHKDDHTLIRREGLQSQIRFRGTSKRMEVRQSEDGTKERVDHATERRKRMGESEVDVSSSE